MILPYVYKLIHKNTGQFYIGSRTTPKLKLPAEQDILKYKSSSKYVKQLGFENFNIEIVAEFFNGTDAFDFEQILIKENINNPLILNKVHFADYKINFFNNRAGEKHPQYGKSIPTDIRKKISDTLKNGYHPYRGKNLSKEHRNNISKASRGVTRNNGVVNSQAKLTIEDLQDIKTMILQGCSRKEIQDKYSNKCTFGHINKVIKNIKSKL